LESSPCSSVNTTCTEKQRIETVTKYSNSLLKMSSSSLVPKNPSEVMVIRKVSPAITTLSLPFFRFGRLKIGGRGTLGMTSSSVALKLVLIYIVVRLQSGAVAVFSPVALTPEVKETVAALGEVKYIAALDIEACIRLFEQHYT
jgi:hypothetical protein